MDVPKILTLAIHMLAFLLLGVIFGDPVVGDYHPEERDALYALKYAFNHPILNRNWNHLQCFMNNPNTTWIGITCADGRVTGISLDGLGLAGQVPSHVLFNLTELTRLSFRNNSISGGLMDFSANPKLTHVDLSNNLFGGVISPSLAHLQSLVSLKLQGNFLTGEIPSFNQSSLREFNVSNNNLTGKIPSTSVLQSSDESSYNNNPGLCGPPSPTVCRISVGRGGGGADGKSSSPPPHKKSSTPTGPSWIAVFLVIALSLVIIIFFIYYKKVKKSNKKEQEPDLRLEKKVESSGSRVSAGEEMGNLSFIGEAEGFKLSDLLKASAEELGKGSLGCCYMAMVEGLTPIVVKRMRDLNSLSSEQFANHMRILGDLKHPNLLPFLAHYYSRDDKLLIYRFMPNGNLFDRIHGGKVRDRIPFRWNSRLLVAQGVARAMSFLHLNANAQITVPHGNLKSSNVLLDEDDLPLVSDYGLGPLLANHLAVQRMVSYKSPEYQHGIRRVVSKESDVWSYGNLVLELITGRASNHSAPPGVNGLDLCSWANRAAREEWTCEIFDQEIAVQRSALEGMLRLLQIALRCCNKSPEKRLDMEQVVREVESIKMLEDDEDLSDRSVTFDSVSTTASSGVGDERLRLEDTRMN